MLVHACSLHDWRPACSSAVFVGIPGEAERPDSLILLPFLRRPLLVRCTFLRVAASVLAARRRAKMAVSYRALCKMCTSAVRRRPFEKAKKFRKEPPRETPWRGLLGPFWRPFGCCLEAPPYGRGQALGVVRDFGVFFMSRAEDIEKRMWPIAPRRALPGRPESPPACKGCMISCPSRDAKRDAFGCYLGLLLWSKKGLPGCTHAVMTCEIGHIASAAWKF